MVRARLTAEETDAHVNLNMTAQAERALTENESNELASKLHWMLKLETDFAAFYDRIRDDPTLAYVAGQGRGRLLRSPTLFEDTVKMIRTTNTTWQQTIGMVGRIVKTLGDALADELHAFPTPEHIRLGYRNAYVLQLAEEVANATSKR